MPALDASSLDAQCEARGVATHYRDWRGQERRPSDATKRAILAQIDRYAATVAGGGAGAVCPAPLVCAVARDVALDVVARAWPLRWLLDSETGQRTEGRCSAAGLAAQPTPRAAASTANACQRIACDRIADVLRAGYHRLSILDSEDAIAATRMLIACPPRCAAATPQAARIFGPAVQLYALRSRRNWGIGDFSDLAALARMAAAEGADFVGVNPLHALFLDRPADASPYSPSSRLALNPLYLDVEAIEDYAACTAARALVGTPAFQRLLSTLREARMVDYAGVTTAKLQALKLLYAHFRSEHLETMTTRGHDFSTFIDASDDDVGAFARFTAMRDGAIADRGPSAAASNGAAHDDAVHFHLYLQWQADLQLTAASDIARAAGMRLGIYRDLAVGANPDGAEVAHDAVRFASGMQIGAPPDEFNHDGQDWGLPPWIPQRITAEAYAPWRALLAANMHGAGALRIDHVMGMLRLYWVPRGMAPADGTYVGYPLEDLLGVLALESNRRHCAVVGEDLGTVPDAVRDALRERGVLSYRVLFFERDANGDFLPPTSYPLQSLVTISTHDLPTLQGYWQATDLAAREALDGAGSESTDATDRGAQRTQARVERQRDRQRLAHALQREGLAAPSIVDRELSFAHVCAVHAYAARTPCAMMTLQLEDVFGEVAQVNLPATTGDQYPNWRRKIAVDLEQWLEDGRFARLCEAIRAQGRGRDSQSSAKAGT
ncbi:MAG: 4-alpha-glucanotransferase [Casimicrobiaceae bacterium]